MDDLRDVEMKIGDFFNDESRPMKNRHDQDGIPQSMQWHIEAIANETNEIVLDVGSGPGTLLTELLKNGIPRGIGVDLSEEMNQTAWEQFSENNVEDRVKLHHGSFLDIKLNSEDYPDAISLHRVLCCHPDRQSMLKKSTSFQPETITITIPRDWKLLRLLVGIYGIIARLTGSFQPYVHSQKGIDSLMIEQNYTIKNRQKNWWWVTTTYQFHGE